MKFLHTSDWHIGRQLHNHSLLEDQRVVLGQIVDLAQQHQVDALVVAGDIFDRSVPPSQAIELLDEILSRLVEQLAIPVIIIAGNHDGAQRLAFAAKHMQQSGLYIVGPLTYPPQAVTIKSKNGDDAVFYPLPYAEPALVRELYELELSTHQDAMQVLLDQVAEHDSQGLNKVVIAHCFLDGGDESDSERPLTIGGADKISPSLFSEFSYTALGHLHGPQYKGQKHIRYSGSPLKYSFSEQHQAKSVTLVSIGQGKTECELLPLNPLRDVRVIEGYLDELLQAELDEQARQDYLMVKLLDKSAILDAMGKLREVYPNVLHLERTGLMANKQQLELKRQHMSRDEFDMFKDFFSQVSGDSLTNEQQDVLLQTIEQLHKREH